MSSNTIQLRRPTAQDGARVWELVRDSGALDLNSTYLYLLLCSTFSDTTLVAEGEDGLLGFVAAFIPPRQPDTVFVWQVGVSDAARGQGLGRRLLDELVTAPACANVRAMEATVSPSNKASDALFRSFARARSAAVEVSPGYFDAAAFGDAQHEPEDLYRIAPLHSSS